MIGLQDHQCNFVPTRAQCLKAARELSETMPIWTGNIEVVSVSHMQVRVG